MAQAVIDTDTPGIKAWDGFHVRFSKLPHRQAGNKTSRKGTREKRQEGWQCGGVAAVGEKKRHNLDFRLHSASCIASEHLERLLVRDNGCALLFKRIITRVR